MEARRQLGDILFKFGGRDGYTEVLKAAQQALAVIRQRLDRIQETDSDDWPAESERPTDDSGNSRSNDDSSAGR